MGTDIYALTNTAIETWVVPCARVIEWELTVEASKACITYTTALVVVAIAVARNAWVVVVAVVGFILAVIAGEASRAIADRPRGRNSMTRPTIGAEVVGASEAVDLATIVKVGRATLADERSAHGVVRQNGTFFAKGTTRRTGLLIESPNRTSHTTSTAAATRIRTVDHVTRATRADHRAGCIHRTARHAATGTAVGLVGVGRADGACIVGR